VVDQVGHVSQAEPEIVVGSAAVDRDGRVIGRVDAVFVDYLLVRTAGLLPVDLYVPRPAVQAAKGSAILDVPNAAVAYARWHRPLRAAPHD
jgi:hypothetical protein